MDFLQCDCCPCSPVLFLTIWWVQHLVRKVAAYFSSTSAFVAFADFDQCYFVKSAAVKQHLRVTPSVYIWDKSNKRPYFKNMMCMPGSTCVFVMSARRPALRACCMAVRIELICRAYVRRFEHYITAFGHGTTFFYAGQDGKSAYATDAIASRGIVRCACVADKILGPDGTPLRASQKPVTLLQYIITTLVWKCSFALRIDGKLLTYRLHIDPR
jgi:hypothetical protein